MFCKCSTSSWNWHQNIIHIFKSNKFFIVRVNPWISTHPLKTVWRLLLHICYKKFHCKWRCTERQRKRKQKNNYAQMKLYLQTWHNHYNNEGDNNNKGVINNAHKVKLTLMWELKCTLIHTELPWVKVSGKQNIYKHWSSAHNSTIYDRLGEINLTERRCKRRSLVEYSLLAQLSVDKIDERAQHQFHHASVASVSTVGRKNMCEWNLLCDASSTPPNTCSGSSVFDFHSRMKSICVSFSRLPILYYRRREFGGCKSPFSRLVVTAVHNTLQLHVFFLRTTKTLKPAKAAFLYWRHRPSIPNPPSCAVLYPTGSEITRIWPPKKGGRKIDREFVFSISIREQHEDSIKQIKKNLSYTL